MSGESDARAAKLRVLLGRLQDGQHVQNREMRKALGDSAYAEFESACREQLELRKQLKDKPDEIRDYEAKLKRAIFFENRAKALRGKGSQGASKLARTAETAFEQLYEKLDEIISADRGLSGWFDREVGRDASNASDLSSIDAPRVVTAKSGSGYASGIRSKRDTKIAAIEHEIDRIENPVSDDELQDDMQRRLERLWARKS
ncbi:hypothetical protein DFR49_1535 [Hephaestia caeni]|uniref:Uncharacterized protein n=1 Tax=Hephaestia caeni TaxID=645617 RepID=A0A397PMM4_9SPHN|nr:hypothetical protein [Hephaestia caeni]RIA46971.1 hypothetical protein DFR49_1535 [Hephaestia caeni]